MNSVNYDNKCFQYAATEKEKGETMQQLFLI